MYSSYNFALLGFEITTFCTEPSVAAVIVNPSAAYWLKKNAVVGSTGGGRSGFESSSAECSSSDDEDFSCIGFVVEVDWQPAALKMNNKRQIDQQVGCASS